MLEFWVPGTPVPQPRPRFRTLLRRWLGAQHKAPQKCPWCGGGLEVQVMATSTPKRHPSYAWRQALAAHALEAGAKPLSGPVSVDVYLSFPRTQATTWKTKPMPAEWHQKRPDASNVLKALEDALDGICWGEDAQIARLHVVKRICSGDPEDRPGAAVRVVALAPDFAPRGLPAAWGWNLPEVSGERPA